MKIRRQNGFSLMEMMVVLLIIAIVLAATTPMVSRRMARVAEGGGEECKWTDAGDYIYRDGYVLIGAAQTSTADKGALNIFSKKHHIIFIDEQDKERALFSHNWSFMFTNGYNESDSCPSASVVINGGLGDNSGKQKNVVVIGAEAQATDSDSVAVGYKSQAYSNSSIAIGSGAIADKLDKSKLSIAIGSGANAEGQVIEGTDGEVGAIAIGYDSQALATNSLAIGQFANVKKDDFINSVAIGPNAKVEAKNAVAIGPNAEANKDDFIVLGTDKHTVYIPGNLIVEGDVDLGTNKKSKVSLNAENKPEGREYKYNQVFYEYADYPLFLSDRRLKNVGEVFKGGLEELKKLDLYHFTFKNDNKKVPHVGIMAQDLQKIFPDAVIQGEDGFLKIRMEDIFYAVVNAVKELDAKLTKLTEQVKSNLDMITALQEKINAQEQEIIELKNQNAEFEKRLAKLEKKNKKEE